MPAKYKLIYFEARARGEVARLLFTVAGVEYEDVRVDYDKDWPSMKPTTPNGQLPLLEIDGQIYCQSYATQRYLAKEFGLAGKTSLDQLRADMLIDTADELFAAIFPAFGIQDKNEKAEFVQKCKEEKLNIGLANLEKMLIGNKGGDGFSVGDELTWADLCLINTMDWIEDNEAVIEWAQFPKLAALRKRVLSIPKIADWIEKRPKTTV